MHNLKEPSIESTNKSPAVIPHEYIQNLTILRMHVQCNMGISDPRIDDGYLLRFLVASFNNVKNVFYRLTKAITLWEEYWRFRAEHNVDNIIEEDWSKAELMYELYQAGYYFTDKIGRPVYIERVGCAKFDQILKNFSVEEVYKMFIFQWEMNERLIQPLASKIAGKRIDTFISIIDLKGLPLSLITNRNALKILSNCGKLDKEYFVERVEKCFIINAPFMFSTAWTVIKQFLGERTKNKIEILGSNYKKRLLEFIDIEKLPVIVGGNCNLPIGADNPGPWSMDIKLAKKLKRWEITDDDRANAESILKS